jgi:hypothetical protein
MLREVPAQCKKDLKNKITSEITANTVKFMQRRDVLEKMAIPYNNGQAVYF